MNGIAENLHLVSDEEVRGLLSGKYEYFKAHSGKARRETLLMLHNDVIEELQQLEVVETAYILEEGEQGD